MATKAVHRLRPSAEATRVIESHESLDRQLEMDAILVTIVVERDVH